MSRAVVAVLARPAVGPSRCQHSKRQQLKIAGWLEAKSILSAFTALVMVRIRSLSAQLMFFKQATLFVETTLLYDAVEVNR